MHADGWGQLLGYIGCAVGIFLAASTAAIVGATLGCASMIAQNLDG